MKTNRRLMVLGFGLATLLAVPGPTGATARAEDIPTYIEAAPPSSPGAVETKPDETRKAAQDSPDKRQAPGQTTPAKTPAAAPPSPSPATVTPTTAAPPNLNPSPALSEVIRLIQGGVSEEVLQAYITNSTDVFNVGADEILYLHDLGAPPNVITTLIQRDASPEINARRQALSAVKPLPPGVALTTPATNVFATAQPPVGPNPPPEPTPVSPPAASQPQQAVFSAPVVEEPANTSYFYGELAPYGAWIEVPGYGHCWRPTVAVWNSSWRPYADGGHWLWSDCGWYWYSDYSWGWAPFHYGRWSCPAGIGWVWLPDTCWGPAWVSWRHSSGYCGWAPLPPSAVFVAGHGFYHNNVAVGLGFDFGLRPLDYVFVSIGGMADRRPHYLAASHSTTIFKETVVVNNYVTTQNNTIVNHGVGFDRIAHATRGNIRQVAIKGTSDVRITNTRREVLNTDGTTLSVLRPSAAALAARSSAPAQLASATPAGNTVRPRIERTFGSVSGASPGLSSSFTDSAPLRKQDAGVSATAPHPTAGSVAPREVSPNANAPFKAYGRVIRNDSTANQELPRRIAEPRSVVTPSAPATFRAVPSRPESSANFVPQPQRGQVAPSAVPQPHPVAPPQSFSQPSSPRIEAYRNSSPSPSPSVGHPVVTPSHSEAPAHSSHPSANDSGHRGNR